MKCARPARSRAVVRSVRASCMPSARSLPTAAISPCGRRFSGRSRTSSRPHFSVGRAHPRGRLCHRLQPRALAADGRGATVRECRRATPIRPFAPATRVSCQVTPTAGYADVPTTFSTLSCPDSVFTRRSSAEICASSIGLNVPCPGSGVSHASTALSHM